MVDDRAAPTEARFRFPSGCAIIFGASGAIGQAVTTAFAAAGVNLVLTAHSGTEGLANDWHQRADVLSCDITSRASVEQVVAFADERHGRIHSTILCHGARYGSGLVADGPLDQLRLKLDMDLFGFLHVVQAAVPRMRIKGGGSITTIVTPAIDKKSPGYGLASTPKVAVAKLVEYLALEEGGANIRANAVAPGVLEGGGMASKIMEGPASAVIRNAVAQTPLGRTGSPAEVADLILYLSSLQAAYVTGQIIDIDGGYSL
ncbi:SDR family NAD(P)-dependent oxidoreductase [Novosphingobium aquimarinum]|uniref:SDR family NAD(P)-dependent oxidoreductase n=1 Tax=Novosphingobium aquimarinum TaxID=2682494 RepID=UPI0012ECA6E2|nr:SDR family oxidoreductase [Novosphingobium aquimarinum]